MADIRTQIAALVNEWEALHVEVLREENRLGLSSYSEEEIAKHCKWIG